MKDYKLALVEDKDSGACCCVKVKEDIFIHKGDNVKLVDFHGMHEVLEVTGFFDDAAERMILLCYDEYEVEKVYRLEWTREEEEAAE